MSFAIVSDTQYVDKEDGSNFDGSRVRHFRESLKILSQSCQYYASNIETNQYSFGVLLGDVLDMKAVDTSRECFERIQRITQATSMPWHYLVGNHDLICFDRNFILENYIPDIFEKSSCSPSKLYYSFTCEKIAGIRFIMLDSFEVSFIGPVNRESLDRAVSIIKENPNMHLDPETGMWNSSDWLKDLEDNDVRKRYIPCGGGLGEDQLNWLRATLHQAKSSGERCIVFSHMPCFSDCTAYVECCLYNSEDVLNVIHEFGGLVIAFFAGHDHTGGYAVDSHGIHHVIPPAPLECNFGDAFGEVFVRSDHLELGWFGSPPPDISRKAPWPARLYFPSTN